MQISRHWRMNAQRYRLEGVRTVTVEVRTQPQQEHGTQQREQAAVSAPRAAVAAR